jgi:hypothetical protein
MRTSITDANTDKLFMMGLFIVHIFLIISWVLLIADGGIHIDLALGNGQLYSVTAGLKDQVIGSYT